LVGDNLTHRKTKRVQGLCRYRKQLNRALQEEEEGEEEEEMYVHSLGMVVLSQGNF
jgi:hypothetical protein